MFKVGLDPIIQEEQLKQLRGINIINGEVYMAFVLGLDGVSLICVDGN